MRRMPGVVLGAMLLWMMLDVSTLVDPASYEQRLTQALGFMQQGAWQQAMAAIGELERKAALTPEWARLWFVRGILAQKLQDPETARQAFERVWQGYPPLADYAAWEMVQYDAAHDLLPTLQKTVTTLAERYPFSRLLPESRLLLARTQHRLGQSAPARATLERLVRDTAEQPIHVEAMAFLGQVYEDRGEFDLAAQILRSLGETHPRDKQAAMALRHSRELFARLPEAQQPPDPEQLLASIDRLAEGQLWQEIEARLHTLDTLPLPEMLVIKVLMKRAAVEVRRGRPMEAHAVLQDVLRRYPQGPHLAEAYYLLGAVYQRQNQPANSIQAYEMGLVQPPTFPWTAKTLWALARLQEERQELARAIDFYQRLTQDFPAYEQAESSLWRAGWLQYCQRRYYAATALWQSFEQRFPRSPLLPQMLYWQARAAQQEGHQDTALRLYQRIVADYPVHYYTIQGQASLQAPGVRSALATDTALLTTPVLLQDPALLLEQAQGQPSKARFHLVRVLELQQLQMSQQTGQEIRSLAPLLPSTPAAQYFLASLYVNNQQYAAAFRALNSVVEALSPAEVRGLPRDFWAMLYPQVFWPQVSQLAQTKGLNPYLVLSIIRQESAFNPAAISSSGARGLMQLMPTTAQELLTKLKLPQEPASRLHDPQLSITLGTHYFAGLMQRYQGNVVLALTGYNAGPARAARWREQWSGVPTDEFIERIPLDETRNYVKLILRNLTIYERLYKASQATTVLDSQ
jgi:soluble lytic murein transglycosylase-like protein